MDRPGVCKVPEGSGEQRKMEETCSEIICGAPTTLTRSQLRDRWWSPLVNIRGGTTSKFESWKVQNHIQDASQHIFYCFLRELCILKSGYSWKSPIHVNIVIMTVCVCIYTHVCMYVCEKLENGSKSTTSQNCPCGNVSAWHLPGTRLTYHV